MTTTFLNSLHYTVVAADDPATPLCPDWLTESEAQAIADDLTRQAGESYIVVDTREMECEQ